MTIFQAYNDTKKSLAEAGIEDYVFEAKEIIKHITGFTNAQILTNYTNELTEYQQNNLTALVKQRKIRYPLQYIFGQWGFYGNTFYVGPGVLVPRADTETLVDKCLEFLKDREQPSVLDLCAGSGCIGITIAKEIPNAEVIMVEKFDEAKRYAEKNILTNKVENATVVTGDVLEGDLSDGKYDLIVSNPPYISTVEMNIISPETKFEPETALFGGEDGLKFYRAITENYKNSLKSGGMLAFEVGINEYSAVSDIMEKSGFSNIGFVKDLNGIQRVVFGTI